MFFFVYEIIFFIYNKNNKRKNNIIDGRKREITSRIMVTHCWTADTKRAHNPSSSKERP